MALYFNATTPDPMQHANHTVPRQQQCQNSPLAFHVPRRNSNTLIWNELERRVWGRVNAPANALELSQALKQEWVAIPARVIPNPIQFMPERSWTVIGSRGGHTPYWRACHSVSKHKSDWTFSWTRSALKSWTLTWIKCKMKYDGIWFFVEFSNNSTLKQTRYAFILMRQRWGGGGERKKENEKMCITTGMYVSIASLFI